MKTLTKKILEAGLVDKHAAMMLEKWGQLDRGASDLVGQKKLTQEGLEQFAEEIEALIDAGDEQERWETMLEPIAVKKMILHLEGMELVTFLDAMGNVWVIPEIVDKFHLHPGSIISTDNGSKQILELNPIDVNGKPFYQLLFDT